MREKSELRRTALARRRTLWIPGHAEALAAHAGTLAAALAPGVVVAGYVAFRDEADPQPLMRRLAASGHRLALPRIAGKDLPLVFHRWRPGDDLVRHDFGMMEPRAEAVTLVPAVVLVPLLAFDAQGYRLGYGGGFYDQTLAALRAAGPVTAVGIAYAGQQVDAVPHDGHDARLDAVLTENGLIRF